MPPDRLLSLLQSDAKGLSAVVAKRRLKRLGRNVLRAESRISALRLFARQFGNPLILILISAASIAAVVRDWTDAAIVLAIVMGSGLLSFAQEHRASRALEQLRTRVQIRSLIVRDGKTVSAPSEEIVPGDVIALSAGSLIPADGVVLEAKDFFVTQSILTGESMPVEKQPGTSPPEAGLAQRTNCVFMGTSVRSGTARILAVQTGALTVFGGIAEQLRLRPPETEFERGIRQYGNLLVQIMLVLVLVVFATNVLLDRPPEDSLLFAIALAVGMSPELLPAIVSVSLSKGARDMAARGVIVRRLNAIENFGSMDILCSDKTGTLTAGVMALDGALDTAGQASAMVLNKAYLNAHFQTGMVNPLDDAIVARAERDPLDIASYRKVDEIPYDFVRKRLGVVVQGIGGDRELIAKGALANVLEICDRMVEGADIVALDDARRARIEASFAAWGSQGYRILGIATKPVAVQERYAREDEAAMVFAGFLLFLDPPKEGVRETLAALSDMGIQLKVITGDNRHVAAHLARMVGLRAENMLTGSELAVMRDEALWHIAERTDLFVEVDPNQKERIILALKKTGHVVGYLGDGINDASALYVADVGISVDQAVDVAKEAADLLLLDHDLDVLRQGVEQGRTTFANTLKYIAITTSANFGNMISMAAASFFLPFLPLLAKQILLNNLLSDFPAMSIAGDNVDPEMVRKPRRWDNRSIRKFMIVFGLISSAFDVMTFGVLLYIFATPMEVFRTGWFTESLLTELVIVLVLRTYRPFYRSKPGRLLWLSVVAVVGLTLALPYLPIAAYFDLVPLPPAVLAALVGITVLYAGVSEMAKHVLFRRSR